MLDLMALLREYAIYYTNVYTVRNFIYAVNCESWRLLCDDDGQLTAARFEIGTRVIGC